MATGGFHEDFGRQPELKPGSVTGFAGVMTTVAAGLGIWLAWKGSAWAAPLLAAALALPLLAWKAPGLLEPLNRAWFRLGLLLGRIVAPVVMGLVFFGVVTPIGLLRRLLGKDSLSRRWLPQADSYWIPRQPPGPEPEQLHRQF